MIKTDDMDAHQLSRWISLFEAVNIISDTAEDNGKNVDFMHIKKLPLDQYVKHTSALVYRELTEGTSIKMQEKELS